MPPLPTGWPHVLGWGQAPAVDVSLSTGNSYFRTNRSFRLPAGTPRYENWVHWLMEGFRCRLCPPPNPWLGTSPSPTFLCSDSRREPAIPDQSPGHAFAPTTLTRLVHIGLNSYDRSDCLTGGGAVITLRTVLRFPNLDTGEASRTNHEWPILRKNSTNQAKLLRR